MVLAVADGAAAMRSHGQCSPKERLAYSRTAESHPHTPALDVFDLVMQ
jgi:hypothetical protein